jgi:hypothetical protein
MKAKSNIMQSNNNNQRDPLPTTTIIAIDTAYPFQLKTKANKNELHESTTSTIRSTGLPT